MAQIVVITLNHQGISKSASLDYCNWLSYTKIFIKSCGIFVIDKGNVQHICIRFSGKKKKPNKKKTQGDSLTLL